MPACKVIAVYTDVSAAEGKIAGGTILVAIVQPRRPIGAVIASTLGLTITAVETVCSR